MGIVAVDPLEPVEYVAEADKKSDDKTIFLLKPLSSREKIKIMALIRGDDDTGEVVIDSSMYEKILLAGLAGWKNMKDSQGRQTPFKKNNKHANLDRLPEDIFIELGNEILRISGFTGDEEKN